MPIRAAGAADVGAIEKIVERAYGGYVERIGMRPGPMNADYGEQVERGIVSVIEEDGEVLGLLVFVAHPDHMLVENVAVDPERQGGGIGRELLEFAEDEARAAGLPEMRLYTHAKMTENRAMYARLGYVETDRRDEEGFDRVFFVKRLEPDD
jgi:ribosomal protein S18 acetylase RimI-like enzyme